MEDILIAFDKLTSAKQTEAVATLIKEGGKFLDLDDILSAIVETFDLKAVVERIDSIAEDIAY